MDKDKQPSETGFVLLKYVLFGLLTNVFLFLLQFLSLAVYMVGLDLYYLLPVFVCFAAGAGTFFRLSKTNISEEQRIVESLLSFLISALCATMGFLFMRIVGPSFIHQDIFLGNLPLQFSCISSSWCGAVIGCFFSIGKDTKNANWILTGIGFALGILIGTIASLTRVGILYGFLCSMAGIVLFLYIRIPWFGRQTLRQSIQAQLERDQALSPVDFLFVNAVRYIRNSIIVIVATTVVGGIGILVFQTAYFNTATKIDQKYWYYTKFYLVDSDKSIEYVCKMPNIKSLTVQNCNQGFCISSGAYENISQLKNLEELSLSNLSQLNNSGLKSLQSLKKLRILTIHRCDNISLKGLENLKHNEQLRILQVDQCKHVSDSDLAELGKRMPQCTIPR